MATRAAIGNIISGTTSVADTIIQSIGTSNGYDTNVDLFFLKGIQVYQRGSASKSIKLVLHKNDQLHASEIQNFRWGYYNNLICSNVLNPALITWSAQPSVIESPNITSFTLGPNVGDYAHIIFDTPVEILMRNSSWQPNRCIGLQVAEIAAYDLAVTWIYEMTRYV